MNPHVVRVSYHNKPSLERRLGAPERAGCQLLTLISDVRSWLLHSRKQTVRFAHSLSKSRLSANDPLRTQAFIYIMTMTSMSGEREIKNCSHCGHKNEAWEANCVVCKKPFVPGLDPDITTDMSLPILGPGGAERPNGKQMASLGAIVLVFGLLALLLGWILPASLYSFQDIDFERLNLKINLMFFGSILSELGALAFFSGKIIEALYFLPQKGS